MTYSTIHTLLRCIVALGEEGLRHALTSTLKASLKWPVKLTYRCLDCGWKPDHQVGGLNLNFLAVRHQWQSQCLTLVILIMMIIEHLCIILHYNTIFILAVGSGGGTAISISCVHSATFHCSLSPSGEGLLKSLLILITGQWVKHLFPAACFIQEVIAPQPH